MRGIISLSFSCILGFGCIFEPPPVVDDVGGQATGPTVSVSGPGTYSFSVASAGSYTLTGNVIAPNESANSFFIDIDSDPTNSTPRIWDVEPLTSTYAARVVSWRGNGTYANDQYQPKVWSLTAGSHTLYIRARESGTLINQITVSPFGADTTPPTVSLTSPANGTTYSTASPITITATASDNVGVTKVEFYDGTQLLGSATTTPYSYTLSVHASGTHALSAKAYDAAGNVGTSSTVTVTVNISTSSCPSSSGATYYVSTSGSDSNAGTAAAPLRTITKAYSKASAGTVIIVMPGTYTDYQSGWGLHLGSSGTATAPIYLCSQTRGAAIIDGQYASDRNQAVYIDGSYNVLDGFAITGGPHGGISIWANGNQLLRNEIHHNGNRSNVSSTPTNGQDGVYSNDGTSDNVYLQNYIHDNGRLTDTTYYKFDHGLYLCGNNERVIDNISVHNASMGLQIAGYTTVTNMKVYNNVFSFNGGSGMVLWMDLNGLDIKNNIIFGNQKNGIYDCSATGGGVVIDHNVVYGNNASNNGYANYALSDQCGSVTFSYTLGSTVASDPRFTNASTSYSQQSDFQLQTGSPAIDAGLALSAVTVDIVGTPRPAGGGYDIGAFER
jgi:hypothetical protein